MNTNSIGLSIEKSAQISGLLNELLANFQIYYQNLRGIHWNIKGQSFFDLHVKFEELYNDSNLKIDLIAERILTLEHTPLHTHEDYIKVAKIRVGVNVKEAKEAIVLILDSLKQLIVIERSILQLAADASDEGTVSMMSDFISEQEKTVWMMKAWLA
jgi:starvation-inducible DNA-binding protein